jgi:hypothetical protein
MTIDIALWSMLVGAIVVAWYEVWTYDNDAD